MFSFFRKKVSAPVPHWAAFSTSAEYQKFIGTVTGYFKSRKLRISIEEGIVRVFDSKEFGEKMGLANLAQLCRQEPVHLWKELITDHFQAMMNSRSESEELGNKLNDLDYAMSLLCVRIYPAEYIEHIGFDLVLSRPVAGELHTMLVFDLPSSVQNVKPNQIEQWGFTLDELFDIALRQTIDKYPCILTQQPFNDESIWLVTGDHFFTSTILLDRQNHPELMGVHGSLVSFPNRHTALFYPIESRELPHAMNKLAQITHGMFRKGPGSLSDQVFLLTERSMVHIPSEIKDNKLEVFPPDELVELLNVLLV